MRKQADEERIQYQTTIAALVDEVAKISSEGETRKIAKRAEGLAKERIERARKRYRQAKAVGVAKFLGASFAVPGGIAWISSLLTIPVFTPAAVLAAVSLAGVELLASRDKAKEERDKTGWSYIFRVRDMERR